MKKLYSLVSIMLVSVRFVLAQNVSYVTLNDDAAFSRSINTSNAVGVTPGSAGVTASGAATYSIPIAVPPGTNDLVPQIGLAYNSQAGNDIAGYGWTVAGMSSISRVQKDLYHDNEVGPIALKNTDPLVLDGQRLILFSGNNGETGSEYRTEMETYNKITKRAEGGFWIKTKDGITKEYGQTLDSRVTNANGTILQWKLNKIRDNYGNYIEFKYSQNFPFSFITIAQNHLTEIAYTGNTNQGLSPYNKIQFSYKRRNDINSSYQAGKELKEALLLDKITVSGENNALYKSYQLNYAWDSLYSFLNEIIETGSTGQQLNSTIFKYGENRNRQYHESSIPNANYTQSVDIIPGDYNGDGFQDLLISAKNVVQDDITNNINDVTLYNTNFKIFKRIPNTDNFEEGVSADLPINYRVVDKKRMPNFLGLTPTDYDGDGANDFMTINRVSDGTYPVYQGATIYRIYNNANNFETINIPPPPDGYNKMSPVVNSFLLGDFDGDTRLDFITILSNYGNSSSNVGYRAFISFPARNLYNVRLKVTDNTASADAGLWALAHRLDVVDFDGDGKSELMRIKSEGDGGTIIYSIDPNGDIYEANAKQWLGYPTKWHSIEFGDFNGDKKTDIFTKSPDYPDWSIGYSTGVNFSETTVNFGLQMSEPLRFSNFLFSDFNGDGKTDFFYTKLISPSDPIVEQEEYNDPAETEMIIYYSNGLSFKKESYSYPDFVGMVGYVINTPYGPFLLHYGNNAIAADLNGDGSSEIVFRKVYTTPIKTISFGSNSRDRLLHKIMDGYNTKSEFSYNLLTSGSPFYKRTRNMPFPLNVVIPPAFMVSSIKADNGISGINIRNYQYEDALFHRTARGFMGFLKTIVTDDAFGTTTVNEYDVNTTFYSTALRKTTTWVGKQRIWQTFNENEFKGLGGKRFYVKVPFAKERNLLGGSTKLIFNTFDDDNGTITSSGTINGSEITSTVTTYTNTGVPFKTQPQSVTTTISRNGANVLSNTDAYEYYSTGALKNKIEAVGKDCSLLTQYIYDEGYGTLIYQHTAHPGGNLPAINVYNYTYDSKKRFLQSKTNPTLNQTETYTYHPLHGKVISHTGIDGIESYYEYDGFGRLKNVIPKLNTAEEYTVATNYVWDIQETGTHPSVYYTHMVDPGKPDEKVWYDKLGRETKKQTEGFDGGWITQTRQYDNRGNVYKKSLPYANETPLMTENGYDPYNRLERVIDDVSGTTTYQYTYSSGNLTTTVNAPDKTTSTTIDPTGKVISSQDPNGTMNFTYDGLGNLLSSKLGNTVMVQSQYDDCGRQKQMTDKSAGTTKYEYNAYGWLTKQINANGQAKDIKYDNVGRISLKTTPEGEITYVYCGTSENGVNKIKEIINQVNGYRENYEYDEFSRVTKKSENIGGTIMSKDYTYNIYDNLATETCNDGFALTKEYYANGNLHKIRSGNTIIYEAISYNGLGRCNEYKLANGNKTSTVTYDNGIPTHFYTAGVQDLQMTVDFSNSNVLSRTDMLKSRFETFEYNKDRLTVAHTFDFIPNLIQSQTMTYSDNGNIESKSDVGNYTYYNASVRPNAVKRVTNPNGVVPNQQQDILYSSFGQPVKITENGKELSYDYGADEQRRKGVLKNTITNTPLWMRHYMGNYERQTTYTYGDAPSSATLNIHYINSPNGLVSIVARQNGFNTFHYTYTDHLGSILTVTNSSGTVEAEQNFDAWGRKRNQTDWTYSNIPNVSSWLYRGYTGHEHLPEFNLINMNGRLYDPLLARLLSPDNHVQSPYFTQSYNRYSYTFNNPLKYIDPSGETASVPGGNSFYVYDYDEQGHYGKMNKPTSGSSTGTGTTGTSGTSGTTGTTGTTNYGEGVLRGNITGTVGATTNEVKGSGSVSTADAFAAESERQTKRFIDGITRMSNTILNNDIVRTYIPDVQTIGLSSNVAAYLGSGTTPINFAILVRGTNPGIYFIPALNGSAGFGIEGNAGVTFTKGWYTGDPREITPSMLQGYEYGGSVGLGVGLDLSIGASYSPAGNGKGFINVGGQFGIGMEGSPAIFNFQGTGQYVPAVIPIFQINR